MKSRKVLICLLAFSSLITTANAVAGSGFLLMLIPVAIGVASGFIKGASSVIEPVATDGYNTLVDIFQNGINGASSTKGVINPLSGTGDGLSQLGVQMQSMVNGLGSSYGGVLGDSNTLLQSIIGAITSLMKKFFGMFGSLTPHSKSQIGNMYLEMSKSFDNAFLKRLKPNENVEEIKKEMYAAQDVLGTSHPDVNFLLSRLDSSAPIISSSVKDGYSKAYETYQKHISTMKDDVKRDVKKLQKVLSASKFSFKDLVSEMLSTMGQSSKQKDMQAKLDFSFIINMMKNLLNLYKLLV